MALKQTFQTEDNFGHPVTLTDTYCRVSRVVGDKTLLHFNVEVLNTEKNRVFMEKSYSFTPSVAGDATNFIAQAYDHLAALDEYAGAVNC
jgi:hypothetical protein